MTPERISGSSQLHADFRAYQPGFSFKESLLPIEIAWVYLIDPEPEEMTVLVGQRLPTNDLTFPGGKLEQGRTPILAAIEETEQETGIRINEDILFSTPGPSRVFRATNNNYYRAYPFFSYLSGIKTPEVKEKDKHARWFWLPLKELSSKVVEGLLPDIAIDASWLRSALRPVYENGLTTADTHQVVPAYFMKECRDIRYEVRFDDFLLSQLGWLP